MNMFLTVYALAHRELIRFFRQKNRLIGALVTPLLFWFLIGSGMGTNFVYQTGTGKVNYLQYFFPGTLLMIVLFTAIFSSISIIEDRREGFLQSVQVAPSGSWALAVGKILGGATLAWLQGFLFLFFVPLLGFNVSFLSWVQVLVLLFLTSFAMTGLGFFVAWKMDSVQGFHAVMNLLLMPMWFLSGAVFPLEKAPLWLAFLMRINPLSYALSQMRSLLFSAPLSLAASALNWIVLLLFVFISFGASIKICSRQKI